MRLERQGSLSPDELLDLAVQLTKGLSAAHRVGLIHRDLKPENILIEAESGFAIESSRNTKPYCDSGFKP
ncbi:MAG: protein kinase [Pirellulaceae bacterium]|nr:protein kinase [Pirellulaceae bacterium]